MTARLPLLCVSAMLATLGVAAGLSTPLWGGTPRPPKPPGTTAESRRLTEEKVGTLPTREGLRLRLAADLGDVRILTQNSDQVSYKVRIEVDAREPGAAEVLKRYSLTARNTPAGVRSEEHTSELQSQSNLVCRLLLEKKKEAITSIMLITVIRFRLGMVRHPWAFKIVVIDIQINVKQMLRDFSGITVNAVKTTGIVNI